MKVLHKCFLIICKETKNVYLQEDQFSWSMFWLIFEKVLIVLNISDI